jgi:tousled-like kinase
MVELDNTQRKERISFQLSILQKEELDLRGKLQRLEEERNMFIIRLKMYNDEISCRYARASADNNDRAWPLLADRYQLLSLLGKGGFSEVYKGFDLEDYQLAACKIHHLNSSWTEQCKSNYIKHALRENEIHKRLKHQNIVQLYDTIEINSESFWYLSYLELGQ